MEDYIKTIGEWSVHLIARSPGSLKAIQGLGGVETSADEGKWRIDYDSQDHLLKILQTLRDVSIAFAGGNSGWPPAAVAESLRDKGKLHGMIRVVTWSGPNQQVIRES